MSNYDYSINEMISNARISLSYARYLLEVEGTKLNLKQLTNHIAILEKDITYLQDRLRIISTG